jgi:hypothetical protein
MIPAYFLAALFLSVASEARSGGGRLLPCIRRSRSRYKAGDLRLIAAPLAK